MAAMNRKNRAAGGSGRHFVGHEEQRRVPKHETSKVELRREVDDRDEESELEQRLREEYSSCYRDIFFEGPLLYIEDVRFLGGYNAT